MKVAHPIHKPDRVIVGLSGGVDSSVTAALLLQQGFEVVGVTLRTWKIMAVQQESEKANKRTSEQASKRTSEQASKRISEKANEREGEKICVNLLEHLFAESASNLDPLGAATESAAAVAEVLNIPLRVLDLQERFYQQVVAPLIRAYALGRTPNPCVLCNPTLKFAALLETAKREGAQWIATGHYARVTRAPEGGAHLWRARNQHQDQAYMLYRLAQAHLTRLRLPLSEVESKAKVREIARRLGLPSATRHDSQDLCFMGGGDYRTLLHSQSPESLRPGPIFDEDGKQLGEHQGLPLYTVGQRKGLGISAPEPLYVLRLDPAANALIVGPRHRLARTECVIEDTTFIAGVPPVADTFTAEGRIRYRAPLVPVTVRMLDATTAQVTFTAPQYGVAPGQSLVLYRGDEVLGGGIIRDHES